MNNQYFECSVCLESNILYKLFCEHKFCVDCINQIIKTNPLCPMCRKIFNSTVIKLYIDKFINLPKLLPSIDNIHTTTLNVNNSFEEITELPVSTPNLIFKI